MLALLATGLISTPVGAATGSGCTGLVALLGICTPTPSRGAATSAPTCGGERLAKPTGGLWRCTFEEEFRGTRLDRSQWVVETTAAHGFRSGEGCVVDSPSTIGVSDGLLRLTVRDAGRPFTCHSPKGTFTTRYRSASVYSRTFSQEYGRFEVRAKFGQGRGRAGSQGALWLYPVRMSPLAAAAGPTEIDIAEAYSNYPNLVIPNVHGYTALPAVPFVPALSRNCTVRNHGGGFHTYAVEWTRGSITFEYDGRVCTRLVSPPGIPQGLRGGNPFRVVLSQLTGVGRNAPAARSILPATLAVDYVRVWR